MDAHKRCPHRLRVRWGCYLDALVAADIERLVNSDCLPHSERRDFLRGGAHFLAGDGLLNDDIRRARGDTDGDRHLHRRGCFLFLFLLLEGLLFCFDGCFIFVTIAKTVEHAAAAAAGEKRQEEAHQAGARPVIWPHPFLLGLTPSREGAVRVAGGVCAAHAGGDEAPDHCPK